MGKWDVTVQALQPLVRLFPYTLHSDPPYLPCTVEFYLQHATLTVHSGSNSYRYPAPSSADLIAAGSDSFLAIVDPTATSPARQGNFDASSPPPSYVHVLRVVGAPSLIDIQYWLLYAVRGRSTVKVDGITAFDLVGPGIDTPVGYQYTDGYQGPGEHQGDWKLVVARYDTAQEQLVGVFYGMHGGGIWVWGEASVDHDTGRPIVYSARNTHSCFPPPEASSWQINAHIDVAGLQAGLWEARQDHGAVWDCAAAELTIVCDDTDSPAPPLSTVPGWLQYKGAWSAPQVQVVSPRTFAGIPEWAQVVAADVVQALNSQGAEIGAQSPYFQTFWSAQAYGLETPLICAHLGNKDSSLWWSCIDSTLDGWNPDIPFDTTSGHVSSAGPALAVMGDQMFCVHAGAIDADQWWSTFDFRTDTWSVDLSFSPHHQPMHPVLGGTSPALAVIDGTLWCAFADSNTDLCWTTFDGTTWVEPVLFGDNGSHQTRGGPALAVAGSMMYCMHSGANDNDIWWTTFDAKAATWTSDRHVSANCKKPVEPMLAGTSAAMVAFDGRLLGVFVNDSNQLCWTQLADDSWTTPHQFDAHPTVGAPHLSTAGPALAVYDGVLYCAHLGSNNDLLWCTFDPAGGTWSADKAFGPGSDATPRHQSRSAPALAVAYAGQP